MPTHLPTRVAGVRTGCFWAALFFLIISPFSVIGADRLVLVEEFTATWCGPCKNAGPALDMLLENYPNDVLTLEYHVWNDDYDTPWANDTRAPFYNIEGIPTVYFDGVLENRGAGSNIQQNYERYEDSLNTRMNVPTDVLIDISAVPAGGQTYDVTTIVNLEASGTAKTMRIYLAETLDHWPTNPSYSRNTFRNAIETGVDISLSPGQSMEINSSVTFDRTAWSNFDKIKMIAWAQVPSSIGPAEIFNAAQYFINQPLPGDFNDDGTCDGSDLLAWQRGESPDHLSSLDLAEWQANFRVPVAGDFDEDGDVDGSDFLAWQRGETPNPLSSLELAEWQANFSAPVAGDFDEDGDVDGSDFLAWQRGESHLPLSQSDFDDWQDRFGTVAGLITLASTAVPEPATGLILMLGMTAMIFRRDAVVS